MAEHDLRLVLSWRNSDRVRSASFGDHEITWEEHRAWYVGSKTDPTRFPMVFELDGKLVGVVNFSRIDRKTDVGEWGFYLGSVDAPKGTATTMGLHALDHAFGELGLDKLIGEALATNDASLRYHQRLGFARAEQGARTIERGDEVLEVVRMEISAIRWAAVRPSVLELVRVER